MLCCGLYVIWNGYPDICSRNFVILSGEMVLRCSIFNDRFYLSFFVATHGFRESDFDYYSISYLSAHKSRPNVSICVY